MDFNRSRRINMRAKGKPLSRPAATLSPQSGERGTCSSIALTVP